jgi:hypothetical protein
MNAQIASASSTTGVRRRIAGRGLNGRTIVVVTIALVAGALLASQALTPIGPARHAVDTTILPVPGPAVSAARYYDDLMSQQEEYIQTLAARAMMRRAAAQADDLMAQQDDFIHTMAARASGATGCNDKMLCLSMYSPSVTAPPSATAAQPAHPAGCSIVGTGIVVINEPPMPSLASSCP